MTTKECQIEHWRENVGCMGQFGACKECSGNPVEMNDFNLWRWIKENAKSIGYDK
jgi:hypothetical protein